MSRTPPDIEVLTLESGVGVRLYRPAGSNEPAPALLWIHAGGYVMGTAQQDDRLCLRFSSRLGITVASVDYRLAPENPYPAALGDCYSALTWLASLPAVDPARVAIGGDVVTGDGPYEAADLDEQGPFPMETVYLWEDGPNGTTRMTL